jgi:hypothetical protein
MKVFTVTAISSVSVGTVCVQLRQRQREAQSIQPDVPITAPE